MRNRDYTQEVSVAAAERPVPLSVSLAILALVALAAFFFIRQVRAQESAAVAAAEPVPAKVAHR